MKRLSPHKHETFLLSQFLFLKLIIPQKEPRKSLRYGVSSWRICMSFFVTQNDPNYIYYSLLKIISNKKLNKLSAKL